MRGKHLATALLLGAALASAVGATEAPVPIPLDGFSDAIHHWQNTHGADYPRLAGNDIVGIADNLLLYQRVDGGWAENQDPARILDDAERTRIASESRETGGSFDNRNIYTQVDYLASAYAHTGDERYRDGSLRGIEFILGQQLHTCGGWPHTVPGTMPYHRHLTIADEVTPGVLKTLRKVASGKGDYGFIPVSVKQRAADAVARGDSCLLRLQVRQGDMLTGWAGQYDETSLQPAQGRSFELPALVVQESVSVTRYLMSIPQPSPDIVAAVEGSVAWLRRVQLHGVRLETFKSTIENYSHHTSENDRRLVEDPAAAPLWARFYALDDSSVILANREGKRVARYAEIPRERRTGYEWYGTWPQKLLDKDYPKWRQRLRAPASGVPIVHAAFDLDLRAPPRAADVGRSG